MSQDLARGVGLVVFVLATAATPARGAEPPGSCVRTMGDLVRMNRAELEDLFRSAGDAAAPTGAVRGRAIFSPGSRVTVPASRLTWPLWQGKVFRPDGTMINRVVGLRAITADVFTAESWFDGRPTLVMDYARTSRLFRGVRDEVREVSPGLYLGLTYLRRDTGPELAMFFALDAR